MEQEKTFTWRGIEFDWFPGSLTYVADTPHGRWKIFKHPDSDSDWCAGFRHYTGPWQVSREAALEAARIDILCTCQQHVDYMKGLP